MLGGIADKALRIREGDTRRGCAVAVFVGDDLDWLVLPGSDARVGGAQGDADRWAVNLLLARQVRSMRRFLRRIRGRETVQTQVGESRATNPTNHLPLC